MRASEVGEIRVATRRLNSAFTRRQEGDSILDLASALELLLARDSKEQIGYRLALRVGALCRLEPFRGMSASSMRGLVKKIYDYRSAVAHAATKVEAKRVIAVTQSPPEPTVKVARELLSHILRLVLTNPRYLEPGAIDEDLLDGKLNPAKDSPDF